jgi:uncharacterized membrane protein YhaH (DUF805 family)
VSATRLKARSNTLDWKEQPIVTYQADTTGTAQSSPPPLDLPHYGIGFVGAVKRGFKKYATFKGRASRSEYWWWVLFTFIVYTALVPPTLVIGTSTSPDGGQTPGAGAIPLILLLAAFALGIIVPTLALTVRRLHDAGYSGLLALLMLVPYVGGLVIMIFALMPSSPAGAKYDPIPSMPAPYDSYSPQGSPYMQ